MTELTVVDLYCSAGGVGLAIAEISTEYDVEIRHIGVDIDDHSDSYPDAFIQGDCSDVGWLTTILPDNIDLLWMSPPCNAYSSISWKYEKSLTDGMMLS